SVAPIAPTSASECSPLPARRSGVTSTTKPAKPSATPADLRQERRSPASSLCARSAVNTGEAPLQIASAAEDSVCAAEAKTSTGTAVNATPISEYQPMALGEQPSARLVRPAAARKG